MFFRSRRSTRNASGRRLTARCWSRSRRPRTGRVRRVCWVRRLAAVAVAEAVIGLAEAAHLWSCVVTRCRRAPLHPNGQKLEAADKRLIFYIELLKYSRGERKVVRRRRRPFRRYRWLSFRRVPDGPPATNRAPGPSPVSDHTLRLLGDFLNF